VVIRWTWTTRHHDLVQNRRILYENRTTRYHAQRNLCHRSGPAPHRARGPGADPRLRRGARQLRIPAATFLTHPAERFSDLRDRLSTYSMLFYVNHSKFCSSMYIYIYIYMYITPHHILTALFHSISFYSILSLYSTLSYYTLLYSISDPTLFYATLGARRRRRRGVPAHVRELRRAA